MFYTSCFIKNITAKYSDVEQLGLHHGALDYRYFSHFFSFSFRALRLQNFNYKGEINEFYSVVKVVVK